MALNGDALEGLDEDGEGDDGGHRAPLGAGDKSDEYGADGKDQAGVLGDDAAQRRCV